MNKLSAMLVMLAVTLAIAPAFAEGTGTRGGGDLCEDRIKVIRDDLESWIKDGGPQGLRLPKEWSATEYSRAMVESISRANIRCVGPGDKGFPVKVDQTPKVCRFDKTPKKLWITCDLSKFNSISESGQYVLIHHEYAGLAGIEIPNHDDSNYGISNQISEYLVDQVVKKLAVKRPVADEQLPLCGTPGLSALPVGTRCKTRWGYVYERVATRGFGKAWHGPLNVFDTELTEATWADGPFDGVYTYDRALEICENYRDGELPYSNQLTTAYMTGFFTPSDRHIYWSSMMDNEWPFWATVVYSGAIARQDSQYEPSQSCVGQDGCDYRDYYDYNQVNHLRHFSVRCVSSPNRRRQTPDRSDHLPARP